MGNTPSTITRYKNQSGTKIQGMVSDSSYRFSLDPITKGLSLKIASYSQDEELLRDPRSAVVDSVERIASLPHQHLATGDFETTLVHSIKMIDLWRLT